MNNERNAFHPVPLKEYEEQYVADTRITLAEIEDGLIVQAYGTSPELRMKHLAYKFNAQLEIIKPDDKRNLGFVAIMLHAFSNQELRRIPGYAWQGSANAESGNPGSGVLWVLPTESPIILLPDETPLRLGFFSNCAPDDASELDSYAAFLNEERSKVLSLS